nr:hypothetical protein [Cedecea sp. NFIX57]
MEQQLLCSLSDPPMYLLRPAKVEEDYRGFRFSGSGKIISGPVPCHLTAWPTRNSLKRSVI